MKNWSIASKDLIFDHEEEIASSKNVINQINEDEEDEEEEKTVRPAATFKAARQTMIDRKLHEADNRGQFK